MQSSRRFRAVVTEFECNCLGRVYSRYRLASDALLDYSGVKLDMGPHGMCFNGSRGEAQREIVSGVSPTPCLRVAHPVPISSFNLGSERQMDALPLVISLSRQVFNLSEIGALIHRDTCSIEAKYSDN